MKPFVPPFPIATASVAEALRVLDHPEELEACVRRQQAARALLVAGLRERGVPFVETLGNWVLVRVGDHAAAIAAALKALGIAVQVPDHPSMCGFLRVSTPEDHAMKAFLIGLDTVLAA